MTKTRPVGVSVFSAGEQTDMMKLMVTFCNFCERI